MSQSYYSFLGSPLHLILEDELAEGWNRFHKAFIQAQKDHKERTGRNWLPSEPLLINVSEKDHVAYESIGNLINLLIEINGGALEISEKECTDDYLVKL